MGIYQIVQFFWILIGYCVKHSLWISLHSRPCMTSSFSKSFYAHYKTSKTYPGTIGISYRPQVEANHRFETTFDTYCSQHKGSFVFEHLCQYCIVLNTKGLLFSSIYVNIVLFLTQRVFCFQHLCKYCIVLDTKVFCIRHLCKYCIVLDSKGLL